MKELLVLGPVVPPRFDGGLNYQGFYERLLMVGERQGFQVRLPSRDILMDELPPEDFVDKMQGLIAHADAIATILSKGDQSVGVESAMAAFEGKPQILILSGIRKHEVPRIMAGQRKMLEIVEAEDGTSVTNAISRLASETEGGVIATAHY